MCVYIHLALPLSSNLAMCLFYFLGFNFLTHIYLHSKHNCNKNKEKKIHQQRQTKCRIVFKVFVC